MGHCKYLSLRAFGHHAGAQEGHANGDENPWHEDQQLRATRQVMLVDMLGHPQVTFS